MNWKKTFKAIVKAAEEMVFIVIPLLIGVKFVGEINFMHLLGGIPDKLNEPHKLWWFFSSMVIFAVYLVFRAYGSLREEYKLNTVKTSKTLSAKQKGKWRKHRPELIIGLVIAFFIYAAEGLDLALAKLGSLFGILYPEAISKAVIIAIAAIFVWQLLRMDP